MSTPGKTFYDRQVDLLAKKDVKGLIDQQYHPDGILVGFEFTRRGRAELLAHYEGYMEHLGYIKLLSTDHFAEIEDAIFFEATVETQIGIAVVYDVFILKDGKAMRHFTGIKSVRPKES